eukprot:GHUV01041972.1.p2 GENE.GHUV01041972.1~~GHUV01041972.1.p2  ORF type:complete len:182 (+),score=29.10 GHUV01041972.1:247-792(+)
MVSKTQTKEMLTAEGLVTSSVVCPQRAESVVTVSATHAAVGDVWMPLHAQTESRMARRQTLTVVAVAVGQPVMFPRAVPALGTAQPGYAPTKSASSCPHVLTESGTQQPKGTRTVDSCATTNAVWGRTVGSVLTVSAAHAPMGSVRMLLPAAMASRRALKLTLTGECRSLLTLQLYGGKTT